MTKMGPNNMSHVIWALGESFFLLFNINNFFFVSIGSIYKIHERERAGTTRTETGPNDVSCIIWALGEPFFFSLYYLILTNILMHL